MIRAVFSMLPLALLAFARCLAAGADPTAESASASSSWPVFPLAAVAGLAAAVLLTASLVARRRRESKGRHWFPDVVVGTRLGAPFGGGKISARNFGPDVPRER